MPTKVKKELKVKDGGTYTNKAGEQKNSWQMIGRLLENENGQFIYMDRHINLAGFPHDEGKGNSIAVSLFDPREYSPKKGSELDDDIPF